MTGHLPSFEIVDIVQDEKSGAIASTLDTGNLRLDMPYKTPTNSEITASKKAEVPLTQTPGLFVIGKLIYPQTWKKISQEDTYFKEFTSRLTRDRLQLQNSAALLFIVFRGDVPLEKTEDLRTVLDIQYFSGMDIITVQQNRQTSIEDFVNNAKFARRWMDHLGIDRPVMPILSPMETTNFTEITTSILQLGLNRLGVDLAGGFPYNNLRVLERIKRRKPELWLHAFQVPPKIPDGKDDKSLQPRDDLTLLFHRQFQSVDCTASSCSSAKRKDQSL